MDGVKTFFPWVDEIAGWDDQYRTSQQFGGTEYFSKDDVIYYQQSGGVQPQIGIVSHTNECYVFVVFYEHWKKELKNGALPCYSRDIRWIGNLSRLGLSLYGE